ncbi:MAG: hypothetical protein ACI4N3_05235 [Alphaproteobacteria bacterium]
MYNRITGGDINFTKLLKVINERLSLIEEMEKSGNLSDDNKRLKANLLRQRAHFMSMPQVNEGLQDIFSYELSQQNIY